MKVLGIHKPLVYFGCECDPNLRDYLRAFARISCYSCAHFRAKAGKIAQVARKKRAVYRMLARFCAKIARFFAQNSRKSAQICARLVLAFTYGLLLENHTLYAGKNLVWRNFGPFKAKIWPFLAKIAVFECFCPITSKRRIESS